MSAQDVAEDVAEYVAEDVAEEATTLDQPFRMVLLDLTTGATSPNVSSSSSERQSYGLVEDLFEGVLMCCVVMEGQ